MKHLTDEEVEREIEELRNDEYVRLARAELRAKYRRRQTLYTLRNLHKRGKELADAGITPELMEDYYDET